MTQEVRVFLDKVKQQIGTQKRVLEIGSKDFSGQIRDLFKDAKEYIGIDMNGGSGILRQDVDITMNAHDIKKIFKRESFDCVICCETLEHDKKFWITIENMKWVLKRGGWMIITVPGIHCPKHDLPNAYYDYWRFMEDGLRSFFEGFEKVQIERIGAEEYPDGWCGVGRKPK